jgi:chromosome segregation ATPase
MAQPPEPQAGPPTDIEERKDIPVPEAPRPPPAPEAKAEPQPEFPKTPLSATPDILMKGEEARRISESAALKSKLDTAQKEKDQSDARAQELEARLKEKESQLNTTEEALAVERMERANIKKRLDSAEANQTKLEADRTDTEDLRKRLADTETNLAHETAERKSLEDLVVQREGDLRKKEEELKTREDDIVAKEKRASEDREKVKAQAIVLADVEVKVEAREKVVKEREGTLAKDEADLEQMEASLKEKETSVIHGQEQVKVKQGELDSMIDQYANRLAQVKLREDKENALETRTKEAGEKNDRDRTELGQMRVKLESDKADITTRSQALYERLQKAEAKAKELDDREKVVKEQERTSQKWQEDLRHTEIHLMSIQDEIDSCVHCSAKDRFMRVDKAIAEAKAIGADVDIPEDEVKGARALLDQGQYDKAVEKASNAIRLAEQAKKQYYSYGVRYTIKTVEKIISSIKELGVSTDEPEGMLKDAKEALSKEDYERAEDLAKMAERIALYTEEKAEEISAGIRRLDPMMVKAKSDGRDTSTAEGIIAQAKDLAKKGNYGSSLEYLREAEKSLLEQQVSSVTEGLKEEPAEAPPPGPPISVQEEAPPQEPTPQEVPPQMQPAQQPREQVTGSAGGPIHQAMQPQYTPQGPPPQPQPQEPQGQRFRCPYCGSVFEIRNAQRPITTSCPYCQRMVIIN